MYFSLFGYIEKGRDLYAEALRISQAAGNRAGESLYATLVGSESRLGNYRRAIGLAEHGLATAQELGNERRAALLHLDLGDTYLRLGEPVAAASEYLKTIAIGNSVASHHPSDVRARIGFALATAPIGHRKTPHSTRRPRPTNCTPTPVAIVFGPRSLSHRLCGTVRRSLVKRRPWRVLFGSFRLSTCGG